MQNILLFLHGGSLNRGCEAIVRTCVSELQKKFPKAKIDLASYRPEEDAVIANLVNKIIYHEVKPIKKYSKDWFLSVINTKIFKKENYAYKLINNSIVSIIDSYDIFISVGGDNYCYGEQPDFYEINRNIKKKNKKLFLWGASIGEEDLSPDKIKDLETYDAIFARESLTYEVLKKNGLQNLRFVADGAFLMEPIPVTNPLELSRNSVGFNFSPLVFNRNSDSQKAAVKLLQHIIDTTDLQIVLVSHVTQKNNSDYDVLKEFYKIFENTSRVILLSEHLSAPEIKFYISQLQFFIGARTHATIAAYSSCVPTLVLGYSIKSKGIAKDIFGEEKLVLGINEISDANKLIAAFEEMRTEELSIKKNLENRIPEIQKMSEKAKEFLAEIV